MTVPASPVPPLPDAASLADYRRVRDLMVSGPDGIRAYRVTGDLIRHCELHRDMQISLARCRAFFSPARNR